MKRYPIAALLLLTLPGLLLSGCKKRESALLPAETVPADVVYVKEEAYSSVLQQAEETGIRLEDGLYVTSLFPYSGVNPEDPEGAAVENAAAATLVNLSPVPYRYLEFTVSAGDAEYSFFVSTLPVGARLTVVEKNAVALTDVASPTATVTGVSAFASPLSVYPEQLRLSYGDEKVRAENITDETLVNVCVYYKSVNADGYLGGLTYRVQLGDLAPGQVAESAAAHLSMSGSRVVFVTIGPEADRSAEG